MMLQKKENHSIILTKQGLFRPTVLHTVWECGMFKET